MAVTALASQLPELIAERFRTLGGMKKGTPLRVGTRQGRGPS
jgi:hypothetical protein